MPDDHLELTAGTVDLQRRTIRRRTGQEEALTEQEHGLLSYLAERPGRTVPREELLERVWGYSPRAVTRAIDIAVRRLRQKVEVDPAEPVHVVAVRGVGYRFEPLGTARAPVRPTLPHGRTSFVGRSAELDQLGTAIGVARLITVTGPPGVGKSRLALELGRALIDRGRAVAYVALGSIRTDDEATHAVAEAIGAPTDGADPDLDHRLGAALDDRGALVLILDDAEHLTAALAPRVTTWLNRARGLIVLIASRERLRVAGEEVVRVGPLEPAESVALCLARARAVAPDWGAGRDAVVAELVARLDHNPLAIEFAAARAEVLPPEAILAGLSERFRLLGARSRDASDRQATLYAAIDWSWSLLTDEERTTLARVGVFEGGFAVASAEAVLESPSEVWALDLLQALVDRSLVHVRPAALGQVRYHLPESVRMFARSKAVELGIGDEIRQKHQEYYVTLGERYADRIRGAEAATSLLLLAMEAENLRAALDLGGDPETVARLALALDVVFALRGPGIEREGVLERALAAAPPDVLRGRLHLARARVVVLTGSATEALAEAAKAAALAASTGDADLDRRVLLALAELHGDTGDLVQASAHAERCAASAKAAGDPWFEARALRLLALCRSDLGDADGLGRCVERLGALAAETGDLWMRSTAAHLSGRHAAARGRSALAIPRYREAMELAEELGDRRRLALAESDLAAELSIAGDLEGALVHFERVGAIHRAMGYTRSAARSAANAGAVLVLLGRSDEAVRQLDVAVADARQSRSPRALAGRLNGRALARWLAGDPELARHDLAEAAPLVDREFPRARNAAIRAMIAAELGEVSTAEAALAEAIPLEAHGAAVALLHVARAFVAKARGDRAALAGGQALLAEVPTTGVLTRPPDDLVLAVEVQVLIRRLAAE